MATGGGARAWRFLKRNDAYAHARRALADGAPEYGDAPFALRRQSAADRAAARFGLLAWEDPFARDGPASPFWAICCMQHIAQDVAVPIMLRCRQFLLPDADRARITAT